jgi:hypothetical protein
MTKDMYYKQAIDLLMNSDLDFRAMIVRLAKEDPETFINLTNKPKKSEEYLYRVVSEIKNGNKVSAIKILRENTGFMIKESKDIVDNLYVYIRSRYSYLDLPAAPGPVPMLSGSQLEVLDALLKVAG